MEESKHSIIILSSCRICLANKTRFCPLFKNKLSENYAEMLTAIADVKVAAEDGLPDKICVKCCNVLKKAYLLKVLAERSDRRLRSFLKSRQAALPTKKRAGNSLTDVKKDMGPLNIKNELKWEMELEVLTAEGGNIKNSIDEMKDITIANTVIRKDETKSDDSKDNSFSDGDDPVKTDSEMDTKVETESDNVEYLDDSIFQDDDDAGQENLIVPKTSLITCYPVTKKLLKRPKNAKILKVHPNYKTKKSMNGSRSIQVRDKPLKVVKTGKPIFSKQKEELVCPECGILTIDLGNHMITHKEKKRYYTCAECSRTFNQRSNFVTHLKQHAAVRERILCEICGAGFYSSRGLARHNLIHKKERPFGCNICPKRFYTRCDLNRHLRIHFGYKPYKCTTCTMSFNTKFQLQNHERKHTGERPFICQVCNVDFMNKIKFNDHVFKVHNINVKFKSIHVVTEEILQREMKVAGESQFNARGDLNRLQIHPGYKPYKCGTCTMSFKQKIHLQTHERKHTGERPYTCLVCNVDFKYKKSLNNHVDKVHGINLKFKSIHVVTEEILRKETEMTEESRIAMT